MTSIRLDRITKRFGETTALDDVTLDIAAGELFFLLGPSGCGKSTLLRIIAGLQEPTAGRVFFNDLDVTRLGTEKRNAVMVFQSYALWPHMSVRENVRFGLNARGVKRKDRGRRIDEVLKLVRMDGLASRKPNELSGGQQQRVALARALAVNPACLLLDEPLSNLDAKLRQEMRGEIRRICKSAGFTTVYVTHDQKEALGIADRIAVMDAIPDGTDADGKPKFKGKLAQVATPAELYHRPATSFVASFIGQANLLPGKLEARDGAHYLVQTKAGPIVAELNGQPEGSDVVASIRPEQLRIAKGAHTPGRNRLEGKVIETIFLGEASEHVLDVNGERVKVVTTPPLFQVPERLAVEFEPGDVVVLPK